MITIKFLDKFKRKQEIQKRDEPISPPIDDPLLTALLEGSKITREKAMTLPAVAGNVDFISNTIATMPICLYERTDGKIVRKDNDVRVKLLNGDTGDTLDGFQFKKAIVEDYLLGKGGVVNAKTYKPFEFLKILRRTKDGASSESLTSEISKALETAYQTLVYQLGLVQSGETKKGFLKSARTKACTTIEIFMLIKAP